MSLDNCYQTATLEIDSRTFVIQVLKFDNGNFVSIAEGDCKIGATIASVGTGQVPSSTMVIPAKSESLFLKLLSQQLSAQNKGINFVSAFIPNELSPQETKTLISKVLETVGNEQ